MATNEVAKLAEEFPARLEIKDPISPRAYLNYLDGWYARAFADLSPAIIESLRLCLEANVLTDEDVHHLATCKRSLADREKLAPMQLEQWLYVWGKLMTFLRDHGVERVEILVGAPATPTDAIVYPWMAN